MCELTDFDYDDDDDDDGAGRDAIEDRNEESAISLDV